MNIKKIIISAAVLSFVFFVFGFLANNAKASVSENTAGYAWSDTVGWISFNCIDNSCASTNYGVNVDLAGTGNLSGYAWSDTVGWISFNSADLAGCPKNTSRGDCLPYYDSVTKELHGWARATSACKDDLWNGTNCTGGGAGNKAGGWGGWISLNCAESNLGCGAGGSNYKVFLNGTDFKGFAYGGMVVGWMSFNCSDVAGTCGTSKYKVHLVGTPPVVSKLATNKNSINYCTDSPLSINLSWVFNDAEDGAVQTAYKLKITRSDGAIYDPGKTVSANTAVNGMYINSIVPGFIRYNSGGETYAWEVTVYDSMGLSDGPKSGPKFSFPLHKYPDVGFTPPPPYLLLINTPIEFKDTSTVYGGAGVKEWKWDFGDGKPGSKVKLKPPKSGNYTYVYTTNSNNYTVKLKVTDSDNYWCEASRSVKVPLPWWKEVNPR